MHANQALLECLVRDRLAEARADGSYTPAERVVVLYRISSPVEEPAYGLFAMVDTDQISTSADEPGLVIRNEDVFAEKVRERIALAEAVGHLLSPVLLLQTGQGERLHAALAAATGAAGAPAATDVDQAGRTHAIWPLGPGPRQDELLLRWGYPYVLEEWRFHLTLTGRLPDEAERTAITNVLRRRFGGLVDRPLLVRDLCVFRQSSPDRPFSVLARFRLGGGRLVSTEVWRSS